MKHRRLYALVLGWLAWFHCWRAAAREPIAPIPEASLESLMLAVKPKPGESPWRDIDWITSITEARRRAVAENKPLIIFTAADGSPLGRT